MSRTPATRAVFVIQTRTRYGWEDVNEENTRSAGAQSLREYRENQPDYPHRMITRRERITPTEATR